MTAASSLTIIRERLHGPPAAEVLATVERVRRELGELERILTELTARLGRIEPAETEEARLWRLQS